MPHLADCAAHWADGDTPCYTRPAFVLTTQDGTQTLVCVGHVGDYLTPAVETHGEAVVTAYTGP